MSVQPSKRVLKAIGRIICHDLARDKECPRCAERSWRIAVNVLRAQEEDRADEAQRALDRIVGSFKSATEAV